MRTQKNQTLWAGHTFTLDLEDFGVTFRFPLPFPTTQRIQSCGKLCVKESQPVMREITVRWTLETSELIVRYKKMRRTISQRGTKKLYSIQVRGLQGRR